MRPSWMLAFESTARTRFLVVATVMAGALAPRADAEVWIDTTPLDVRAAHGDEIAAGLRRDIERGVYDGRGIALRVVGGGEVAVDAAGFAALSELGRAAVIDRLLEYYEPEQLTAYRASVATVRNGLESVDLLALLGIQYLTLPARVGAEQLLSPYARSWAYRSSSFDGPNCWHTAVATTTLHWSEHRYMNPNEFSCHMRTAYVQIYPSTFSDLEYGDVVRLVSTAGEEVHAFVYLGPDRRDARRHIVFTKNGYMRSTFLYQDIDTLTRNIYPGNRASYFRSTGRAIDPASYSGSSCAREYGLEALPEAHEVRGDPVLLAGVLARDPRTLEPVDLGG